MKVIPNGPTPQVRQLADALRQRGLNPVTEYFDGHKHVDIAFVDAKVFIEVDGLHHVTDPDQIIRDIKRDHFSDGDDFNTIHISNLAVEKHLDQVADAFAEVVRRRTGPPPGSRTMMGVGV